MARTLNDKLMDYPGTPAMLKVAPVGFRTAETDGDPRKDDQSRARMTSLHGTFGPDRRGRPRNRFIMVAPNGGRKTKADHKGVPVTVPELLECGRDCRAAGANALHAHVRDRAGNHVLDVGQYRELIREAARTLPDFEVQITTESLGRYTPREQRQLVRDLNHSQVSIALREQDPEGDEDAARRFYFWAQEAKVEIQHILYSPAERARLEYLQTRQIIPNTSPQRVLFVLGRYRDGRPSDPANVQPFLDAGTRPVRWMTCAFGQSETACLVRTHALGGEMRIGFENNDLNADGSRARDNAERVRALVQTLSDNAAADAAVRR